MLKHIRMVIAITSFIFLSLSVQAVLVKVPQFLSQYRHMTEILLTGGQWDIKTTRPIIHICDPRHSEGLYFQHLYDSQNH